MSEDFKDLKTSVEHHFVLGVDREDLTTALRTWVLPTSGQVTEGNTPEKINERKEIPLLFTDHQAYIRGLNEKNQKVILIRGRMTIFDKVIKIQIEVTHDSLTREKGKVGALLKRSFLDMELSGYRVKFCFPPVEWIIDNYNDIWSLDIEGGFFDI